MKSGAIVIVGASRNRAKFGNKAVRAYLEKGYTVYPIHPTEIEIEGLRVYRSVAEIPEGAALASFYIPPHVRLKVIEEIARTEIKTVYLNPGSESGALIEKGEKLGVEMRSAASSRRERRQAVIERRAPDPRSSAKCKQSSLAIHKTGQSGLNRNILPSR